MKLSLKVVPWAVSSCAAMARHPMSITMLKGFLHIATIESGLVAGSTTANFATRCWYQTVQSWKIVLHALGGKGQHELEAIGQIADQSGTQGLMT